MDREELKDLLLKRLYIELLLFKDSMIQKEKADILKASYKIEIYVNLYEIFVVHVGDLQEDTMRRLLNLNFGILESIYQEWLGKEDSFYEELSAFACKELENIAEMQNKSCGKESGDGTEFNQAA